jgi:NAD(P)-dependent dehydrogenase (short-subunit alcohol dehydrogenase family)
MARRLQGKVALVAGGAGGIGAEICSRFLEEGAIVVCADKSRARGEAVVQSLAERYRNIGYLGLDARESAQWDQVASGVIERHGRLDILVTAIYSGRAGSVESMPNDAWQDSFDGTSSGVFYGMRACAKVMTSGAAIVNIASTQAHGAAAGNIGYSSAKASVIAMSRSAAAALASRSIRVNIVTPGPIQTWAYDATVKAIAGNDERLSELKAQQARQIPLGRIGLPRDVANAVLFLASDEASYVTGAELLVDGGLRTG